MGVGNGRPASAGRQATDNVTILDRMRRLMRGNGAGQPHAAGTPREVPAQGYDNVIATLKGQDSADVMVVFEAAHSGSPGRPSDPVVRESLETPFCARSSVEITFPADRLQIDQRVRDHHLICIGGPRSNVVSRAVMEYENRASEHHDEYYTRISRPCIPFPIVYVQNPHAILTDRIDADLAHALLAVGPHFKKADPPNGKNIVEDLTRKLLTREPIRPRRLLVNRNEESRKHLDSAYLVPIELKPGPDAPTHLDANGSPEADVVMDFVWITIMPNPYAPPERKLKAIIVAGCTSFGTSAFLSETVIATIDRILKEKTGTAGQLGIQVVIPVLACAGSSLNKDAKACGTFRFGDEIRCPIMLSAASSDWMDFQRELQETLDNRPVAVAKQIVELNRMDANQLLRALQYRPRDGEPENIFVLGCFEGTKTFATQQGRALSFVHAIHKSGRFPPDMSLVVIGGGLSGLTTAVAAAATRIQVRLIEQRSELLGHLSGAKHRFIHPTCYDWPANILDNDWPRSATKQNDSGIPLFPWPAGSADKVTADILASYRQEKARVQRRYGERRIIEHKGCVATRIVIADSLYHVYFNCNGKERFVVGDAVVITTGFGKERDVQVIPEGNGWWHVLGPDEGHPAAAKPIGDVAELAPFTISKGYWENDDAAFQAVKQGVLPELKPDGDSNPSLRKFVVVSGQGDGALIDILRLGIKDFDHKALLNELCFGMRSNGSPTDRAKYLAYKELGRAMARATSSDEYRRGTNRTRFKFLEEALTGLPIRELFDLMELELEPDVRIVNVTKGDSPFMRPSATAHRLLVWSLFLNKRVEFISGTIESVRLIHPPNGDGSGNLGRLLVTVARSNVKDQPTGKASELREDWLRRVGNVVGLVFRHGNRDGQTVDAIPIQDENNQAGPRNDAFLLQQLISILNLTSRPHPETIKFFLHNIRQFR